MAWDLETLRKLLKRLEKQKTFSKGVKLGFGIGFVLAPAVFFSSAAIMALLLFIFVKQY